MSYERKTFDIEISDNLKTILQNISRESVVAKLLLKKRHQKEDLVENPVNFISVSGEDSGKISYLTKERIDKIFTETEITDLWSSSKRFHAKPGAFVSKVFKDIPAKEVEIFSNLFKAESSKPNFQFKVVLGEDIRKYYHHSKHQSESGSLGVSCMRYDRCQPYFDLYCENPEVISMLVMLDEFDKVLGRSILWQFGTKKLMDRIYTANDEKLSLYFKKWAYENGFLHRKQQNWYNSIMFQDSQNVVEINKTVVLKNFNFDNFPYMDTFRFLNRNTGELSNFIKNDRSVITLCGSEGNYYGRNYLGFDQVSKVFRHCGELVYLDYLDISTSSDNCRYSEVNDCYILPQHSIWHEDLSDYIFSESYSHFNNQRRIEAAV